VEIEWSGEAAIERRHTVAAKVVGSDSCVCGSSSSGDFSGFVHFVLIVQGFSCGLVDACILRKIPCVERKAFSYEVLVGGHVAVVVVDVSVISFDISRLDCVRKPENLVVDIGDVEVNAPCQVLLFDEVCVKVEFGTGVAHISEVDEIAGIANGRRSAQWEQHVVCLPVEVVYAACEAAIQHFEFKAGVEVGVGFPSDARAAFLAPLICDFVVVVNYSVGVVVQVVSDVVVALWSDGSLELQLVEQVAAEEAFLGDDPGSAEWPEVAPAVILRKARRGVAAEGERSIVLCVVIVHRAHEVSFVVVDCGSRIWVRVDMEEGCKLCRPVDSEVVAGSRNVFALVVVVFVS